MSKITFLFAVLFCGVCFGQPPADTFRVVQRGNTEYYQNRSGKIIGRSDTNISKGRTYYNNYGMSSRSQSTQSGQRFTPNTTNRQYRGTYSSNPYGHFGNKKK